MKAISVLIVDDQDLMRAGLRMILDAQEGIHVVGEASDGVEAVAQAELLRPAVVLMDIRMPRMDGVEATRKLAGPRVVILTTFDHDEYVVEALRAGASAFLLKDAPPDELVHAIRVVAAGRALLAPAVTRALIDRVVSTLPSFRETPPVLATLTARERDVLEQLGRGQSNAEMAQTMHISEATVKTHVAHVLDKLGLRDRVQAVIFGYESGVITPGKRGSFG